MKQILAVVLCIMFHIQYAEGQYHNIEGDYVRSKSFEYISIKGNRLYYIERQPHMVIRYNDTLAICDYTIIDDHIIEINSTYREDVERNMVINQTIGEEKTDSIDVKFVFPYSPYSNKQNPWKISVCYSMEAKSIECNDDFHVKIPGDSKVFSFDVTPTYYIEYLLQGHYWGLLYYLSSPYIIKENCKAISVSNCMLNDGFFERYYPKNEYLYIKGKEIHWKGKIFKKSNKHWDWM